MPAQRVRARLKLGPPVPAPHSASRNLGLRRPPFPQTATNIRELRTSGERGVPGRNRMTSRDSAILGRTTRTTENRGVPGSSPGLAIDEVPAKRRTSSSDADSGRLLEASPSAFPAFSSASRSRNSARRWSRARSGRMTRCVGEPVEHAGPLRPTQTLRIEHSSTDLDHRCSRGSRCEFAAGAGNLRCRSSGPGEGSRVRSGARGR